MSHNSEILTVSYGTFACTLEGAEKPFEMMMAVTEYFQSLAAADRYFGAEPPMLDGAVLEKSAFNASPLLT